VLKPSIDPTLRFAYNPLSEIVKAAFLSREVSSQLEFWPSGHTLDDLLDGEKFRNPAFFGPQYIVVRNEPYYLGDKVLVSSGQTVKLARLIRDGNGRSLISECGQKMPSSSIVQLVEPAELPFQRGMPYFNLGLIIFTDDFGRTKKGPYCPIESLLCSLVNLPRKARQLRRNVFPIAVADVYFSLTLSFLGKLC
jgi:hypothetical protein